MKSEPKYLTEAALCSDFISWVKRCGGEYSFGHRTPEWTPYAETAGWDILLVAPDGTQIGVQAKLRFNLKVIAQSIPDRWDHWHDSGPDYRAVLVPERDGTSEAIAAALGLVLFVPSRLGWDGDGRDLRDFAPGLDMAGGEAWHYWSPRERCKLPEFVPDVQAGASGPVQLTDWKVAALRIVALLEIRGHVTRADFRRLGIDPRRWTGPQGWLIPGDAPGQFKRGAGLDFDRQHPSVYPQVLAEERALLAETEPAGLL